MSGKLAETIREDHRTDGVANRAGRMQAEEDPAEHDGDERRADRDRRRNPHWELAQVMRCEQEQPLVEAPDDEVERGAVPEAAEAHRRQEVGVPPPLALAVPAERDVEVVTEPTGERHVPAPPE